jgi:hypothetical protein
VGALITVGVTYLSRLGGRRQFARTVSLSATIGMMLAVSLVFDHPFTGRDAMNSLRWDEILGEFIGGSDFGAGMSVKIPTQASNAGPCRHAQRVWTHPVVPGPRGYVTPYSDAGIFEDGTVGTEASSGKMFGP